MRPRRTLLTACIAASLGAGLGVGCGGSDTDKAGGPEPDDQVVLTLANMDADPTNIDSPDFIAAVERLSGGSIRIEETHGWNSDAPLEEREQRTIEDVRSGKIDLAIVPARAWDTVGVTSFQALVAPFLVDSIELERLVLQSPLASRMLEGVEPLGLVGVALLAGPLRYPLGVSKPLVGPADYEGATIGIRPSGVAELTFRTLGGEGEVFEPGSVAGLDGAELDPVTIATVRYEEQAKALTANVVLWPRAMTVVMNQKAFYALGEAQQDVLRSAGLIAVEPLIERFADHDGLLQRESVCGGGDFGLVAASPADLEGLRAAVQPVYEELERDPLTRELITAIRAMRGKEVLTAEQPLRCSEEGVAAAAAAPEQLEGRWEATLTRDELVQEGRVSRELAGELAGAWSLELADGKLRLHNPTVPLVTGTYTVEVDVLTIVWQHGTGLEPGSLAVFGWSLYRDSLTLFEVPDGEPLHAMMVKPWKRADAA